MIIYTSNIGDDDYITYGDKKLKAIDHQTPLIVSDFSEIIGNRLIFNGCCGCVIIGK